ncbi:helix-turn-helix domain-containing protein [Bacillus sp. Sa1BUA2]|uniref:Helix-turn-helix domain-containing protein n=1 Tax=Bacillus norwichensis TaxID=2762217 RepID=A0ABR8VN66_9BACI|nr:helix-turn-helix domain-containing protein [Bacillus norwichensis]
MNLFIETESVFNLRELVQRPILSKATVFRLLSFLERTRLVVKSKHSAVTGSG